MPLLVESFVERLAVEMKKRLDGVSAEAMSALMAHDWPGNVRELRNVLERGAVVATGPVIQVADLGLPAKADAPARAGTLASLEEVEKRHVARRPALLGRARRRDAMSHDFLSICTAKILEYSLAVF